MRFTPFLTAALVCAFTYMLILERETLLAFAGVEKEETVEEPVSNRIEDKPPVSVMVLKSKAKPVERGIVLRGQTAAFRLLDVKSETSGQVISTPLRAGTMVGEGELLCRLDEGTKKASLAEAKARLAEAQANNNASASLVQKGYASETTAISRVAQLEAAQAAVDRAEKEMDHLEIHAPFSGILETDTAEFGALMQPGATCARILELNPIKLVGFATEQQVKRIAVGGTAGARLIGGETVVGKLTFISRSSDPQTRTFKVEVTVPNENLKIRDGSTAEIYIALSGETGHLLPQSSLTLNDEGVIGVRVVNGETAKFMPVNIINETSDGFWVSGLGETAEVIVVGQEYVVTGRRVTVTYQQDES
ncbi:efflux RND transporter periplasmic adaptor subunit [Amylibacter sp. IMCC11727]|uniref:efflux RND transporter periplasmic adaptor subunit n=1 Tax=Amylibacter sp. IMCC11727 TaxID=3039851 RepID=UPI00244E14AE|nr:efflux RND transporter periplasmic adaptor subunit [Amylibacter sp. IMCC11727]WGI23477.1 efflux RND transporter periplasmic adaptor subunit [Amylibacter sp. IMCC11727]